MNNGDFADRVDQPYVEVKKLYKYDVKMLHRPIKESVIGTSIAKDGTKTPWPTNTTRNGMFVAIVCEDHDNIYFVTPQSCEVTTTKEVDELREFIPELMKFIARAPDGSIIKCFNEKNEWVMEME
jgi:hypothetical protein